jgi:hypothetical protein
MKAHPLPAQRPGGPRSEAPAGQSPAPVSEALLWGMLYGSLLSLLGWGLLLRMLLL